MPASDKLARWIDLIAVLLRHRYPRSFEEIAREIPAYADETQQDEARMRMFERDKDELRGFGVPIESVTDSDGSPGLYQLRGKGFYLPYLVLRDAVAPGVVETQLAANVRRPAGEGYAGLAALQVTPEHLVLLRRAAERVLALDDATLGDDARAALRKLQFDLADLDIPVADDGASVDGDAPGSRATAARRRADFGALVEAVRTRKEVTFTYRSMHSDDERSRRVAPYGLVFRGGRWYLVARDVEREEDRTRLFRLTRVDGVKVNPRKPHTADFEPPADFSIALHASATESWNLGDGAAEPIDVALRGIAAEEMAHRRLGAAHEENGAIRRFDVRRRPVFLRWLLSWAGDAVPVAPAEVVEAWQALVRETYAVHAAPPTATSGDDDRFHFVEADA